MDAGEAYVKDMIRLIGFLKLTAEEFERTGVVFDALWVLHERCNGRHGATDGGAAAEESSEAKKEWQKLLQIRKGMASSRDRRISCLQRSRASTERFGRRVDDVALT